MTTITYYNPDQPTRTESWLSKDDLLLEIDRLLDTLRQGVERAEPWPRPLRVWETPWFSSDIGPSRHTPTIIVEPTFTNVSRLT